MFDTMTGVKIVGGFCGALLVFLMGSWAAESIYHVGTPVHDGEEIHQAYVIEVEDADEGGGEPVEEVAFAEVFAAADAAAGEGLWRQCSACHRLEDGANATGPHLYGVVERPVATVADYAYSATLAELGGSGLAWTPEELNGFLANPSEYAPGTKMTYRGLSDVEDRADLIAYLGSIGS
ncbi:c-type cytochrome [Roseitranquillus sediminis]|uniref:c-type cytochrome n=1 Tax=Roseitranquillus sediminis TaxID=2809051 RepID=UPI001D0C23E9|nr:cytochrome c family protein [Roseitranquillus sediminis]MBM9593262.1 cytochrome c family protein [Roseitranquillus sediminis]